MDANGRIIGNYGEVKSLIEEINGLYPGTIELIGMQIQGYNDLSQSIDDYLTSERTAILLQSKKDKWSAAIVAQDEASGRADELKGAMDEAERQYAHFSELRQIVRAGADGDANALHAMTEAEKTAFIESGETTKKWIDSQVTAWQSRAAAASQAWAENQQVLKQAQADIDEYEAALSQTSETANEGAIITPPSVMPPSEDNSSEILANWAKERFDEFKSAWDKALTQDEARSIVSFW